MFPKNYINLLCPVNFLYVFVLPPRKENFISNKLYNIKLNKVPRIKILMKDMSFLLTIILEIYKTEKISTVQTKLFSPLFSTFHLV